LPANLLAQYSPLLISREILNSVWNPKSNGSSAASGRHQSRRDRFTDLSGNILSADDSFLNLLGLHFQKTCHAVFTNSLHLNIIASTKKR
jgi:hypothetical protein